ncbi:hypothetical protein F750_0678 [Streptomyces sp. PAMC 26508]|nr:hypothetical protein F750_0678 [Streptomyces sp. PAMC 26508]
MHGTPRPSTSSWFLPPQGTGGRPYTIADPGILNKIGMRKYA